MDEMARMGDEMGMGQSLYWLCIKSSINNARPGDQAKLFAQKKKAHTQAEGKPGKCRAGQSGKQSKCTKGSAVQMAPQRPH